MFLKKELVLLVLQLVLCSNAFPLLDAPINSFQVAANLVRNGDFQNPQLYPGGPYGYPVQAVYVNGTNGWYNGQGGLKIQIIRYTHFSGSWPWVHFAEMPLNNQVADLDSYLVNEKYFYILEMHDEEIYQFSFNWAHYFEFAMNNGFRLYFNGSVVLEKFSNKPRINEENLYFQGCVGNFTFLFEALGPVDSIGIFLDNISLRKVTNYINQSTTIKQQIMSIFALVKIIVNENGAVRFVLGYLIELNHIPLYLYHSNNYTLRVQLMLQMFSSIGDSKTAMADNYILPFFGINTTSINQMYNFKAQFSDFAKQQSTSNNYNCLIVTLIYFLLCNGLVVAIIFGIMNFLFYLLIRYQARKFLKKYYFLGFILLMLFDGKLEQLSYSFFNELLLFVNFNFLIKMHSVANLLFYFATLSILISLPFIYLYFDPTISKILIDQTKINISGFMFYCYLNAIFNILLGAAHRLLNQFYIIQLYTLGFIEFSFIFAIIYGSIQKAFKEYFKFFIELILSIIRITLILIYFYINTYLNSNVNMQRQLDFVAQFFLYSYLSVYIFAICVEICKKIFTILKFICYKTVNLVGIKPESKDSNISQITKTVKKKTCTTKNEKTSPSSVKKMYKTVKFQPNQENMFKQPECKSNIFDKAFEIGANNGLVETVVQFQLKSIDALRNRIKNARQTRSKKTIAEVF